MIPELGHFALVLALAIALLQGVFPLAGAHLGRATWMAVAAPAARVQLGLLVLSFTALAFCFADNDFSVAYVAANSNSLLPLHYRLSAIWGAHEGSLLLWVLILAAWAAAVSYRCEFLPRALSARVLGVMGTVSAGFLMFLLLTSNPFERLFPAPLDGADLNPLLQDPGLIIHPPMLYTGYVGFSVAFGFAIAALLEGRLDPAWARWARPWTTVAWAFLTLGIALGSFWAYYELGWGGWWFWDPVENASFMPWLAGTALIHSLAATEKRGVFKNWTVLLAICAFALSLLGTFLVRSGVLTSVHAFATDPGRGIFVLALLGIVIGGSLSLYALRAPSTLSHGSFDGCSRETFLLINSVLLTVAMSAVLLGTLYPLAVEVTGGKISVGAPYFNAVFVPLMVPVFVALGAALFTRWRSDRWQVLATRLRYALLGSVVTGLAIALVLLDRPGLRVALAATLAAWVLITSLAALVDRVSAARRQGGTGLRQPAGFYGMTAAHVGLALCMIGIAVSANYSTESHRRMGVGDSVTLSGYEFRLDALQAHEGPNYEATRALFSVQRGGEIVTRLHSEKRFYHVRAMPMTEAGIDGNLARDLYVSLGEPLEDGDWSVRLYYKPMVRWIWLGALCMALGGLLAASDRRYRRAREARIETSQPAAATGASR